eukprot:jgi/Mesen1/5890/ME000003S06921
MRLPGAPLLCCLWLLSAFSHSAGATGRGGGSLLLPSQREQHSSASTSEGRVRETRNSKKAAAVCSSALPDSIPANVPAMPSMWWSNVLRPGAQVQLRTAFEKWVGPRVGNDWGSGIWGGLREVSPDIFFTVVQIGEGQIGLKAPDGNIVGVDDKGSLTAQQVADGDAVSPNQVFQIRQGGENQIQLQAHTVGWLSAADDGALSWAAMPSQWEAFDVREVKQVAAIRGVNLGGWLVIEGWMTPYLFAEVPRLIDGAEVQIRSVSRRCFVSADWAGGGAVKCHVAPSASKWESFRVRRESPDGTAGGLQLRTAAHWFCSADAGAGADADPVLEASVWQEPPTAVADVTSVTFRVVTHPSDAGLIHIQGPNSKYLEVQEDGSLAFTCAQPSWGGPCAFAVSHVGALQGEWQIGAGLGREQASALLDKHRREFITEADFEKIAAMGLNFVRIPVGYWITQGDEADGALVPGGIKYLDAAMEWGAKHGLRVLVDIHGAPGSQNGNQESGSRDGVAEFSKGGDAHVDALLHAIEWLAERYAAHAAFFGIELLNEPGATLNKQSTLYKLYEEGYKRVRKHSACAYVVFNTPVILDDNAMKNVLNGSEYTNVIQDVHWYLYFYPDKSVDDVVGLTHTMLRQRLRDLTHDPSEKGRLVMVGEWSLGLPMNKHYGSQDYQRFSDAQLDVFGGATAGWVFWSYKNDGDYYEPYYAPWSFQRSWANGWFNGTYPPHR